MSESVLVSAFDVCRKKAKPNRLGREQDCKIVYENVQLKTTVYDAEVGILTPLNYCNVLFVNLLARFISWRILSKFKFTASGILRHLHST